MPHGKHPLKVGMFATNNGIRGRIVALDFLNTTYHGRSIKSPTIDLSTPDGLLVGIAVRNLD